MATPFYRTLGEQYLDFVVFTKPIISVVRVMGTYWHNKTRFEDILKASKIRRYFKGQVNIIDVPDYDLESVAEAMLFARSELIT